MVEGVRKEIFCVSEPQSRVQHISHYSRLSRQTEKKAEASQAGASAMNGCINKNISSVQTPSMTLQ